MIPAVYIAAMVSANLLVWWLGPWFSPINSFLLIGLDLTLRDVMQERFSKWQLAAIIIAGGAITWGLNPGAKHIAIASAVAFTVSALADWAGRLPVGDYEALRALRTKQSRPASRPKPSSGTGRVILMDRERS